MVACWSIVGQQLTDSLVTVGGGELLFTIIKLCMMRDVSRVSYKKVSCNGCKQKYKSCMFTNSAPKKLIMGLLTHSGPTEPILNQ